MINTVFITGAATGMGCKTANVLADMGWKVYAGKLSFQSADELKHDNITVMDLDITDDKNVLETARLLETELGQNGLKALINNAGVAQLGSGILEGVPFEDAVQCFNINVFGTLRITRALLPLLRKHGSARIVNMSSGAARVPVPTSGIYNMSKMAINGLTTTLRMEVAPFGIQVAAVEPGAVKTPMTHGADKNLAGVWETVPDSLRSVYEPELIKANEYLVKQINRADAPEYIIKHGILRALTDKNPKIRYTVGSDAKMLPLVQRILSEELFEKILRKSYQINKKKVNR